MKKGVCFFMYLLCFCSIAIAANPALVWTSSSEGMKLLDNAYTEKLCAAWNNTSLPKRLGRSGSKWIDSAKSSGHQVIVISRRDCTNWPKVKVVIDANENGDAMCTQGGAFSDGEFQWKFEPKTTHWIDFSDGFGAFKMPKIMDGFVGPYGAAMKNIKNFELFFATAGNLAIEENANLYCEGPSQEDVQDEWDDLKISKMKKILSK